MQALCPQVLVVPGQPRSILREDQAYTPGPDKFRVSEMLQDLTDRPLPRLFRLAQLRRRQPLDRAWQRGCHLAQNGNGLTVAEQFQDGAYVRLRVLCGASCRIRVNGHGGLQSVASARPLYTLMVSLSNHELIGGLVLRQAQDERVQKRQAQETSRTA